VCAAVFSCNGRGRTIFPRNSGESEARILDEVGSFLPGQIHVLVRCLSMQLCSHVLLHEAVIHSPFHVTATWSLVLMIALPSPM
jgi:hypothetical protein